jgi:hypothetical protein
MADTKIKTEREPRNPEGPAKASTFLLFYKCTAILSKYRPMPHGIRYFGGVPGHCINI